MRASWLLSIALPGFLGGSAALADPTSLYDHELRRLHSDEVVNFREAYAGKPLLIVNTASHCGFTGQLDEAATRRRAAARREF